MGHVLFIFVIGVDVVSHRVVVFAVETTMVVGTVVEVFSLVVLFVRNVALTVVHLLVMHLVMMLELALVVEKIVLFVMVLVKVLDVVRIVVLNVDEFLSVHINFRGNSSLLGGSSNGSSDLRCFNRLRVGVRVETIVAIWVVGSVLLVSVMDALTSGVVSGNIVSVVALLVVSVFLRFVVRLCIRSVLRVLVSSVIG